MLFPSTLQDFQPLALRIGLAAILVFLSYQIYLAVTSNKGQLPLPPAVPGFPVIGNLIEIGRASIKGQQHLLITSWARQYGDIFSVKVGPFIEYFLNSDVAVKEVFDKSSAQTAERPRWIVSNEQICNQMNVLLLDASHPRWKNQRKAILQGLTSIPKADAGLAYLHFETNKFLNDLVNDPKAGENGQALWNNIGRYTYSTFSAQTFGMDIPDSTNAVIGYIHETGIAQILGTLPGFHIVDILPWLDKLPLFLKPWERSARARFRRDLDWCLERLGRVKRAMATGGPVVDEAFLPTALRDGKYLGLEGEEEAAYLSLMLIIGAADTSRISTWSFLEAMLMFPDVQIKAQAEIENVVGDRIPVWADLESIPYVRCLMKELWRWRPPVSLGHPHTTTRELVYNGYRVPKGARLHLNAWAIGHDPLRHENPERFWPERYADDLTTTMQSINSKDVKQRDHFAFGAGRRVCPGYHVAERSLAVAIMRILWACNVVPAAGAKIPIDMSNFPGDMPGNAGPEMPVALKIRSEKKIKVIRQTYERELTLRLPMDALA